MNPPITPGSLEWYREIGKTDNRIADLVKMIDRQSKTIEKLIEALADEHAKRIINTRKSEAA